MNQEPHLLTPPSSSPSHSAAFRGDASSQVPVPPATTREHLLVPESRNKGAILAAVLVLAGKHGQGQMAPLMRTQPLHGHQDSVTLTTMVSPRPGFILQHSIKQAVFTIHPVHQGATCIFGCFQSIQEQVGSVFGLLLREPHTHTCPTNKINIRRHLPLLSSSPFLHPHSSAFPDTASFPASPAPPRGAATPTALRHAVMVGF